MDSQQERRLFKRKPTEKEVVLRAKEGEGIWTGVVRDFSKGGVGIVMEGGAPCEGHVRLEFDDGFGGTVVCEGRVIWCQGDEEQAEEEGRWVAGVELISPVPQGYLVLLDRFGTG